MVTQRPHGKITRMIVAGTVMLAIGALAGVLIVRFFSFGTATALPSFTSSDTMRFAGDPQPVTVEIASTDAAREQGLSGHAPLADNHGMLFVFDTPVVPAFWMKGMLFPLDFIWISSDRTVVDATANISPNSYPATFKPSAAVQYVLEVPAGFAMRHSITRGEQVTLPTSL